MPDVGHLRDPSHDPSRPDDEPRAAFAHHVPPQLIAPSPDQVAALRELEQHTSAADIARLQHGLRNSALDHLLLTPHTTTASPLAATASPRATTSRRLEFSRRPVHGPVPAHSEPVIQTKLAIGSADDEYEQEADRIAERVMDVPEPRSEKQDTSSAPQPSAFGAEPASAQAARMQTKRSDASQVAQADAAAGVGEVL